MPTVWEYVDVAMKNKEKEKKAKKKLEIAAQRASPDAPVVADQQELQLPEWADAQWELWKTLHVSGYGVKQEVMDARAKGHLETCSRVAAKLGCCVLEVKEPFPEDVYSLDEEPEYLEFEVAYDTGCGAHVADRVDLPGQTITESPGSRRGQKFTAAGGADIDNEGEAVVLLLAENGTKEGQELTSTFQVAAVSRPLWSVSQILDNLEDDSEAVFRRKGGIIRDKSGRIITTFTRKGGLYVGCVEIKNPKHQGFRRPA